MHNYLCSSGLHLYICKLFLLFCTSCCGLREINIHSLDCLLDICWQLLLTLLPYFLTLPDNGNLTATITWRQSLSVGCPLIYVDAPRLSFSRPVYKRQLTDLTVWVTKIISLYKCATHEKLTKRFSNGTLPVLYQHVTTGSCPFVTWIQRTSTDRGQVQENNHMDSLQNTWKRITIVLQADN